MVLRPAVFALTLRTRTSTTPTRLRRRPLGARKAENWFIEWAQVKVERRRREGRKREEEKKTPHSLHPQFLTRSLAPRRAKRRKCGRGRANGPPTSVERSSPASGNAIHHIRLRRR